MNSNKITDPKDRKEENLNENTGDNLQSDGVYAYNADGSPMDTSERTYISTELPEEETETDDTE